jgi:Fe-S cluster assembly ATP-binding protein
MSTTPLLQITNLHASIIDNGPKILNGLTLTINAGEVHAIMGPNGSGKSTLSKVLAGHPSVEVTEGSIIYQGQDLLALDPDERARLGVFMAFQYPVELPGVHNTYFLRMAYNAKQRQHNQPELNEDDFAQLLKDKLSIVEMDASYLERSVNEGFSGGEKKRNEILQMAILNPTLAILDETDSGLDIDALRIVANGVNQLMAADKAILLVTHYQRLLDYIQPDYVHVLAKGQIIKSGDKTLALELESKGYDWLLAPSV